MHNSPLNWIDTMIVAIASGILFNPKKYIFCETLSENLKNCQCSTHWKLLAALTMTQWFYFRPPISLTTQTSSHFGTTHTYIVIVIYIKIKCCLDQPFTCKQRKSSEPFRLCLEILLKIILNSRNFWYIAVFWLIEGTKIWKMTLWALSSRLLPSSIKRSTMSF